MRGLSLAETVIALFLMSFAVLLCANLFHVGLRYSQRAEQEAVATMIAQKRISELRLWAATRSGPGFNFDDWSVYGDVTAVDPDQAGYRVRVQSQPELLWDPGSGFEAVYALGNRKEMRASAQKVTVTVSWGSHRQVELTTLIADPVRAWRAANPLVITAVRSDGDPLPRNRDAVFRVQGFDSDNRAVPDLMYNWYTAPIDGNGTVTNLTRDRAEVTFTHKIKLMNGNWGFAPGPSRCGLVARAVLGGVERTAQVVVRLAP